MACYVKCGRTGWGRWIGGLCAGVVMVAGAGFSGGAAEPNAIVQWNRVALRAVEKNPPAPTVTTWRLHVMTTAMYDAWAAYDDRALSTRYGGTLRRPPSERTLENKLEAVSYAAFTVLVRVFPKQRADFEAHMARLGYRRNETTDVTQPAGIGNVSARAVLGFRYKDGSNAGQGFAELTSSRYPERYRPVNRADPSTGRVPGGAAFDPNRWQPLRVPNGTMRDEQGNPIYRDDVPSSYTDQTFLTPHWGAVLPFAVSEPEEIRPPAPPRKGSTAIYVDGLGRVTTEDAAYDEQLDEILRMSASLTDREKVIAEFWADGPNTWTPPGHWNQIAEGLAIRDGQTLDDSVKMFFALNGALLDSGVCCWESKRHYDYIRPQSAIRHKYYRQKVRAWGGPNRGTQEIFGEEWRPYQALNFVTPAFAEFTSGHSTFSGSAAEVLRRFTGTDALFDGVTRLGEDYDKDGEEDLLGEHRVLPGRNMFESTPNSVVVLRWMTLTEAADEAGWSRRYGGIHFQDGDLFARRVGKTIGGLAYTLSQSLWEGVVPALTTREEAGALVFIWNGGMFEIQSTADFQAGAWTPVAGRSPLTMPMDGEGHRFFRLGSVQAPLAP